MTGIDRLGRMLAACGPKAGGPGVSWPGVAGRGGGHAGTEGRGVMVRMGAAAKAWPAAPDAEGGNPETVRGVDSPGHPQVNLRPMRGRCTMTQGSTQGPPGTVSWAWTARDIPRQGEQVLDDRRRTGTGNGVGGGVSCLVLPPVMNPATLPG